MTGRLLLLAGTREARELASALANDRDWHVVASLAGVTDAPLALAVETRTGGFGGVEGLADYLETHDIDAVIDATHPFACRISENAVAACVTHRVPLLRVERPVWVRPEGARWISVASLKDAAQSLPAGSRVFLTIGGNSLGPFAHRDDIWFLVRTMEPRSSPLPLAQAELAVGAPSRSPQDEARLMRLHGITHMVAKNSGGSAYAKIQAAAELHIPTIMIERPEPPAVQTVANAADALEWLAELAVLS